jgi:exodeoxyribonuclease VII small subunit
MSARKRKADPPNFEEALENLEAIVGQLEDGSLGLNESLVEFENGMALLRQCHGLLENAEQRIEVLTSVNKDGEERTKPLDGQQTPPSVASQSAPVEPTHESDTDESTLF